jgi:hypothetical protein
MWFIMGTYIHIQIFPKLKNKNFTISIIPFLSVSMIFISCRTKLDKIEKTIEDGVEVVINRLEPYKIKGEPSHLRFEEELRIDFEEEEFLELGIKDLRQFEVDPEGNIFGIDWYPSSGCFIYKFDQKGNCIKKFGRRGQGPGEIQTLSIITTTKDGKIVVTDSRNMKLLEFSNDGIFLQEKHYPHRLQGLAPLNNGNYLGYRSRGGPSGEEWGIYLCLYGPDFKELKEIDVYDLKKHYKVNKSNGLIASFRWAAVNDKIYVANSQRGYEIQIFNIDGNLLMKIRKQYTPAKYPEKFRIQTEEMVKHRPDIFVVSHTPPLNSFCVDEEGRIIVMTYEAGKNEDEYIHDIFNSDGVFIARKSIGISGRLGRALNPCFPVSRNNRYYRLRFKESGYMELIIYNMIWE